MSGARRRPPGTQRDPARPYSSPRFAVRQKSACHCLMKIGARTVRQGRSAIFQMAGVMVSRNLFRQISNAPRCFVPWGDGEMQLQT